MIQMEKARKACHTIAAETRHILMSKIHCRICPGNLYDNSVHRILEMYHAWNKGVLPFQGSFSDQPNKIIECFRVIDNYYGYKMEQENLRKKRGRK